MEAAPDVQELIDHKNSIYKEIYELWSVELNH